MSFLFKFSKDKTWEVEVVKGPNDDWIDDNGHKMFLNTNWKLQSKSDRTGYRLEGPNWTFTEKATNKGLEHGAEPSNIIDQGYPIGAINIAGQTPIILVNDGPSMGGFIVPYTVPSAAFWKLGQAKPGDMLKFKEIPLEKAQEMRLEQTLICSEKSIAKSDQNFLNENKKSNIKIDKIKIVDYEKINRDKKIREKIIEKKGMKDIKVKYF